MKCLGIKPRNQSGADTGAIHFPLSMVQFNPPSPNLFVVSASTGEFYFRLLENEDGKCLLTFQRILQTFSRNKWMYVRKKKKEREITRGKKNLPLFHFGHIPSNLMSLSTTGSKTKTLQILHSKRSNFFQLSLSDSSSFKTFLSLSLQISYCSQQRKKQSSAVVIMKAVIQLNCIQGKKQIFPFVHSDGYERSTLWFYQSLRWLSDRKAIQQHFCLVQKNEFC